jgi:type I restriction enzyme S subunit
MSSFVKLGDLTHIRTGKLDANASSENGQYPFFTCSKEPLRIASYSYDCECVLVAGNGDLNVKYYDGKFDAYQRTYIIESADKRKLLVKYLYFFLDIYVEVLRTQSIGGVIKYIKLGNLTDALIPLPSIERQAEIIECLEKCNTLIDKRQRQIALIEQTVKSRFIELFGDLKSNPMEWPVVSFTEFAKIDGNMTTDYEKYAGYPHIGIDSIEKGTGALKGYRTVREDGVISGKYIFTPQHIIYSKIRPNLNKVALPDFEGLCSADAYPILPNHSNCNRVFLAIALRSEYFLEYILQFSSRTNLPKVNRKEIAGFRMPLPPLKLQEQFAAFVEQTDKSKYYSSLSFRYCQAAANTYRQEWMTCRTSDF